MKAPCAYCGTPLDGNQRRYCCDLHRYRFQCIEKEKAAPPRQGGGRSIAQDLRMLRAQRAYGAGKLGIRFW